MTKYKGLSINKQDNTAEYDKIYRSKHKQDNTTEYDEIYRGLNINKTITILQNMIKYTGLNINRQ